MSTQTFHVFYCNQNLDFTRSEHEGEVELFAKSWGRGSRKIEECEDYKSKRMTNKYE